MTTGPTHPEASTVHDVAVIGTGPAGLVAALALAAHGIGPAVLGPVTAIGRRDTRTTALFGGSIAMLKRLGLWPALAAAAQPLTGLRLIDETGGLLRAPEVLFDPREIGLDAFGYNVANSDLMAALQAETQRLGLLPGADCLVRAIQHAPEAAHMVLHDERQIAARLVVAADGRQSPARAAARIGTRTWSYPQAALAVSIAHGRPHGGICTELHRRAGPLAVVPLPGERSSLVWVEEPREAARLMALPEPMFAREVESRLGGLLGRVEDVAPRASFPLSGLTAAPLGQARTALVGEAGHVLPPIGAQGLNLGFRDAAWIASLAGAAMSEGRDPGGAEVLAAYHAARKDDVARRQGAVDLLNRSLLAGLVPLDLARGAGLAALRISGTLRRAVMRTGLGPERGGPGLLAPI